MKISIFCFFIISALSGFAQKRGLAYEYHSYNDAEALTPSVSWWYNWNTAPDLDIADNYEAYNYEFVPMAWNGNFNEARLRAFLDSHPETKYLLAFNEPNFIEQANMTPAEVAAAWPVLEDIATEYELEIVGPAVNFCGNCVPCENCTDDNGEQVATYTNPFDYLDDFFEICQGCQVDHIAVHVYMNTIEATSWFIGEFKNRYNKPIWVTEFAGWEPNNRIIVPNDQINYMMSAVDFFESEPAVFRYAWFIGRSDEGFSNYPFIDILGNDGDLTDLGEAYINMPVHDTNKVIEVPALLEAENYTAMQGIFLQKTRDEAGFADVDYIHTNDWLTYKISIPETGMYTINYRVASTKTASFDLLVDDTFQYNQVIANTQGYQNWETLSSEQNFTQGTHTLKLLAQTDGFIINWLSISSETLGLAAQEIKEELVTLSPNPFTNHIQIRSTSNGKPFKIEIFNLSGKSVFIKDTANASLLELSHLASGLYLLQLSTEGGVFSTRKITKY